MSPTEYVARELARKDIYDHPARLSAEEVEALRVVYESLWEQLLSHQTGKLRHGKEQQQDGSELYKAYKTVMGLALAEAAALRGELPSHYCASDDQGAPVDFVNVEWKYYKGYADVAIAAYERWLDEKRTDTGGTP